MNLLQLENNTYISYIIVFSPGYDEIKEAIDNEYLIVLGYD